MSRRTIIICLSSIAGMALAIGLAIYFLFDGVRDDSVDDKSLILSQGRYALLAAVPSDAVVISVFKKAENASDQVVSGLYDIADVVESIKKSELSQVLASPFTVSLHYSGKLQVLYLFDLKKVSQDQREMLADLLSKKDLYVESISDIQIASPSQSLMKSGVRHFEQKLSVLDSPGFISAANSVSDDNVLLISLVQSRNLAKNLFADKVFKYAGFFESLAEWAAVGVSSDDNTPLSLKGRLITDGDQKEFISSFKKCAPATIGVWDVLPSYTMFAATLPLNDLSVYVSSYQSYLDSRQMLQAHKFRQRNLAEKTEVDPETFFKEMDTKEVATASFSVGSKIETVNLVRVGRVNEKLERGTGKWNYSSFVASVFGDLFELPDESYYTLVGDWIITGSNRGVEEFASKEAWKYSIRNYANDTGKKGLLPVSSSFVAYSSLTENALKLSDFLKADLLQVVRMISSGVEYSPAVLSVAPQEENMTVSLAIHNLTLARTRAPQYDRDTAIEVPSGPFSVKNSRTGKMNKFYQNESMAICLRNEKGKDLWGVPFKTPICGTAHNLDYYANNKLQIIFGSGKKIYIIDILGRWVTGFPLDLGREIALGPDIYDFSGSRKYNILVLHKDNTIQMYNLKGEIPPAWKGITADETIKALPERLTIGNSDFWVVRTSIQTLIFPFYGGEPITKFSGDRRIRTDSKVEIKGNAVVVDCYDGVSRTVKLK